MEIIEDLREPLQSFADVRATSITFAYFHKVMRTFAEFRIYGGSTLTLEVFADLILLSLTFTYDRGLS